MPGLPAGSAAKAAPRVGVPAWPPWSPAAAWGFGARPSPGGLSPRRLPRPAIAAARSLHKHLFMRDWHMIPDPPDWPSRYRSRRASRLGRLWVRLVALAFDPPLW